MLIPLSLFRYHPITVFINIDQILTYDQYIQVKTAKHTQMLTTVNSEKWNMLNCKSYFAENPVTFYLEETLLLENALKPFLYT